MLFVSSIPLNENDDVIYCNGKSWAFALIPSVVTLATTACCSGPVIDITLMKVPFHKYYIPYSSTIETFVGPRFITHLILQAISVQTYALGGPTLSTRIEVCVDISRQSFSAWILLVNC